MDLSLVFGSVSVVGTSSPNSTEQLIHQVSLKICARQTLIVCLRAVVSLVTLNSPTQTQANSAFIHMWTVLGKWNTSYGYS